MKYGILVALALVSIGCARHTPKHDNVPVEPARELCRLENGDVFNFNDSSHDATGGLAGRLVDLLVEQVFPIEIINGTAIFSNQKAADMKLIGSVDPQDGAWAWNKTEQRLYFWPSNGLSQLDDPDMVSLLQEDFVVSDSAIKLLKAQKQKKLQLSIQRCRWQCISAGLRGLRLWVGRDSAQSFNQ